MDFSLTTLYVLPTTNTLPTTGNTSNLTANQFGVFKPDYTPATTGNIAAQPYIMLAQGRPQTLPGVGTKKSDKIFLSNVIDWYKVAAITSAVPQIITFSNFSATCGEDVTISLRLKSFYLDTAYFNGLTKSYTITTPCCDCGTDPCTETDIAALVASFVALINGDTTFNSPGKYVTASSSGSGSSTDLIITGKVLAAEPVSADPTAFPFQYDRLYFWGFAYKGPETSQDYNVWDSCDPFATVTTTQISTYETGSSLEAKQLEKNYNSYNTAAIARRLWSNVNFNGAFLTQVVDGTFYDFYYLKYKNPKNNAWQAVVAQDESVILLNPTGQNATTITLLSDFLGAPVTEG